MPLTLAHVSTLTVICDRCHTTLIADEQVEFHTGDALPQNAERWYETLDNDRSIMLSNGSRSQPIYPVEGEMETHCQGCHEFLAAQETGAPLPEAPTPVGDFEAAFTVPPPPIPGPVSPPIPALSEAELNRDLFGVKDVDNLF